LVTVHPGGLRELHWHPNADEWQYYINGKGRMTVVDTGNRARTMDFQEGDVGYVQKTLLHYIENTGDTDLVFLEMFGKVDRFQDLSFSEWLAHTPPEAVMAHLRIDKATYDAIPKNGGVVMPLAHQGFMRTNNRRFQELRFSVWLPHTPPELGHGVFAYRPPTL